MVNKECILEYRLLVENHFHIIYSDEEMLSSHLMRCMNYMNGSLFHDKNEIKLSERKKTTTEENCLKAINMLNLKTIWS